MNWTTADAFTVVGVLAMCGGTAWMYPPAGLMLFGVILAAFAMVLDIAKRRNNKGRRE